MTDAEAEEVLTVGQLQDLVAQKLGVGASSHCLTSHVFYRLRAALRNQPDVAPLRIRPCTPLIEVLPEHYARDWDQLGVAAGMTLPDFELPAWYHAALLGALGTLAVAALLVTTGVFAGSGFWPFLAAPLYVITALLRRQDRFREEIPSRWATVGGLAVSTMALNVAALARERDAGAHEVREAVARLVGEVLGVELSRIHPSARFVADLGMD